MVLSCLVSDTMHVFYWEQRPHPHYCNRILGCSQSHWTRLPVYELRRANFSEDPKLINCVINFELTLYMAMVHQRRGRTDRQSDERLTVAIPCPCDAHSAQHRAVKTRVYPGLLPRQRKRYLPVYGMQLYLLTYYDWVPPDVASVPCGKMAWSGWCFLAYFMWKLLVVTVPLDNFEAYFNIGKRTGVILCRYAACSARKCKHNTALFWSAKVPSRTKPERSHLGIRWQWYRL